MADAVNTLPPIVDINQKHSQNLRLAEDKIQLNRFRIKDKKDFSTLQEVLDKKTRRLIEKMINNEKINSITGVINSGKEAVVFQATGPDGSPMALKIFKRNAMDFRRREKYFEGDFRFRSRHLRHNARKMVIVWAEKEYRNLLRMDRQGLLCPTPVLLQNHLLLMQFIGVGAIASPRLKDAHMDQAVLKSAYSQCVIILRRLFSECRLVHADFSEYNLLLREDKVVVIDVGSAVSSTHPGFYEFLVADCKNISRFFAKKELMILSLRELFTYVTTGSFDPVKKVKQKIDENEILERKIDSFKKENRKIKLEDELDDVEITLKSLALSSLFDINEEDFEKQNTKMITSHLISESAKNLDDEESDEEYEEESSSGEDSSQYSESESGGEKRAKKTIISKEEVRTHRKVNKKKVKALRRLKLLTKRPKKVKKRRDKVLRRRRKT